VKLRYYILRRIILLAPTILGISLMTFLISNVIPSNPALLALGGHAQTAQVEAMKVKLGLDKPLPIQFLIYLAGLLRGDLGYSIITRRSVMENVVEYFPATFELTTLSMLLTLTIGIVLGILSATNRDKALDHFARLWALTGVAMPVFWLGIMVQILFYRDLGWIPYGRRLDLGISPPTHITGLYTIDSLLTGNIQAFVNSLSHIIAPALVLSYSTIAVMSRMTRASLLDAFTQDYIKTARAKGLSHRAVVYKHALKNALLPVCTVAGLQYGYDLGGSFLVESVFDWPGMGRFAVSSIVQLDFRAVMGVTLIVALMFVVVNLVVDIVYAFLDPRIRY